MFGHKKKTTEKKSYDPAIVKPVLKCSICTGEQVAGFKNIHSGVFEDVMLIRDAADLQNFRDTYGITGEITKIY